MNSTGAGTRGPYVTDKPSDVGSGSMLKEHNEGISLFNFHRFLPNNVFSLSLHSYVLQIGILVYFYINEIKQNILFFSLLFVHQNPCFGNLSMSAYIDLPLDDRVFKNKIPRWCRIINMVIGQFFIWLNVMFSKFRQLTMAS